MRFNSRNTPMRTKILVDSLSGLMLVVVGLAGVVSYKFEADIELLIVSIASLTAGLGVLAAGSVRRDLYEHMTNTTGEK